MSEKKLKISLDLDDKSFVSAVKRMQDELNKIQSGPALVAQQRKINQYLLSQGMTPLTGAGSKDMERATREAQQQTDKIFQKTVSQLNVIKRLQSEINKELSTNLTTEERKFVLKERQAILSRKEREYTGGLTAQVGRHNAQYQEQNKQFGARLTGAAGIIGGIGTLIGAEGRLPIEAATAAGSAVTFLVGQQLKEMQNPEHQAFLPERTKAIEAAKKAWKSQRIEDRMTNVAATLAAATGIAGVVAAEGLSAGLATPALLAVGGLGTLFGPSKQRAITAGNQGAYEKLSSKDLADLAQQSITAQEQANPLKKLAAEYNAQNYQRNLGIQRGLGLTDQGFMGSHGFLRGQMAYGGRNQFTEEQVTQMQQSILGAGGSARIGRESGFGLQLQKNLNLTNAPQLLAGLSRTLGGAQQTKEASIRVISEAFKQGLNDSELVDLLRGFTSAAGEVIARSGARSQADVDKITAQFGKGMLESTGVGLEAAKTGYEAYQRLSGRTSGPMAIMQRAAMLRNPILKRLAGSGEQGALTFEKLKQVPINQLTEDHPAVLSTVYLHNSHLRPGEKPITPGDVIAAQMSTVSSGASISGIFGRSQNIITGAQKGMPYSPAYVEQAKRMRGISATTLGVGSANELTQAQAIMSYGAQFGGTGPQVSGPSEALKTTTKLADTVQANISASQQVFVDNFEKFKDAIVPASSNIDDLTKKLILLGQVAADVAAGKKPAGDLGRAAATLGTQPQANSSAGQHR